MPLVWNVFWSFYGAVVMGTLLNELIYVIRTERGEKCPKTNQ
jgi:hypothetical protein